MATLNDKTISSIPDLMSAIDTFLVANGFTQDEAPGASTPGQAGWSLGSPGELYVQVAWDTATHFDIYRSLSVGTAPLSPGSESGDSSHPQEVDFFGDSLVNGELWGFTNGDQPGVTDDEIYAYFVLEFNRDGRFVHFGWGHLEKYATWEGGAFSYGFEWGTASDNEKEPWASTHRVLLDSNHTSITPSGNLGNITIRNFLNQPTNGDWGILTNGTGTPATADGDGNDVMKIEGYTRHGPWPSALAHIAGNPNNALIPLIPIEVAAHGSVGNSTIRHMLGKLPDVALVNIRNVQPKQTLSLGGDDWQFFPWAQKSLDAGADNPASFNAGIAYKVLT